MIITIISDIHEDINRDYDFSSLYDEEFVVVAGDISGSPVAVTNWVTKNIKRGVFIEGNHLGYTESGILELDCKEGANRYLKYTFDCSDSVKFLENTTYEVDDVIFAGCTLYTDFNLYNTPVMSMRLAQQGMNDYNYVHCEYEDRIVKIFPDRLLEWHKKSVEFLDKTCEENKDKKIIVVTHHCPSERSIHANYLSCRSSGINPAYASNLEWLMEKHDNLKLWVHGHVHSDFDYEVHGTRVICHPFGYYNDLNRDWSKYENTWDSLGWRINTDEL
jgi:hypothetical protein